MEYLLKHHCCYNIFGYTFIWRCMEFHPSIQLDRPACDPSCFFVCYCTVHGKDQVIWEYKVTDDFVSKIKTFKQYRLSVMWIACLGYCTETIEECCIRKHNYPHVSNVQRAKYKKSFVWPSPLSLPMHKRFGCPSCHHYVNYFHLNYILNSGCI